MFANETPDNINEWNVDDVWKLVKDPEGYNGPSPRVRLNYVKMLYDVTGLNLTPDTALASIDMNTFSLIISTAGSGKTTLVQLKAILMKLICESKFRPGQKMMGKEILCLVYNRHNVSDIENKHQQLVTRLKMAKIKGLALDTDIHVCTMHSFCDFWRKKYLAKLGFVGYKPIEEGTSLNMMRRSITLAFKMLKLPLVEVSAENMLAFYNLCKESLKTPAELVNSDKFRDLGLKLPIVEKCFERYDAAKNSKQVYDYCDILVRIYELLSRDESVLKDVQTYYSVIIADEVQDFTPVMWRLLQLFTSNKTPLVCIGDEDQNIYNFRGADINELLRFSDNFQNGKVYTLIHNRRCRDAIVREAIDVISENTLRFNKHLVGVKPGGEIEFVPYNTEEGQITCVVDRLASMSEDELDNTCVCFREHSSSRFLIDLLEEKRIPFHSLQKALPFKHEIYKHVMDVLNALEMPYDREASINLYKVLPCSKAQIHEVFGYNSNTRRFKPIDGRRHFAQYDFGELMNVAGFSDSMRQLITVSKMLPTEPMSSYMGTIFELLLKYFWNFKKSVNEDDMDEFFEKRAMKFFNYDKPYSALFDSYTRRVAVCRNNNESHTGVTLSTFHGLKGLEFEHVYVIGMDDNKFPNYELIESREYDERTTLELKESETRLWYVAVTRAISDLHVFYSQSNPSKYVVDHFRREAEKKNGSSYEGVAMASMGVFGGTESLDDDFNDDFEDDEFEDELNDMRADSASENNIRESSTNSLPKMAPVSRNKFSSTNKTSYLNSVISSFS